MQAHVAGRGLGTAHKMKARTEGSGALETCTGIHGAHYVPGSPEGAGYSNGSNNKNQR